MLALFLNYVKINYFGKLLAKVPKIVYIICTEVFLSVKGW